LLFITLTRRNSSISQVRTIVEVKCIGVEGSEGITALAVSQAKKYLAVCEKAERALCIVYDLGTLKRRKILTSTDYNAREFISVAFAATNEKSLLCTLVSNHHSHFK
jgi:hypothetical protein